MHRHPPQRSTDDSGIKTHGL